MLAKIESADSVDNLEDILDAVDGAMVARGDLGAELPVEEVGMPFCPIGHSLPARSSRESATVSLRYAASWSVE